MILSGRLYFYRTWQLPSQKQILIQIVIKIRIDRIIRILINIIFRLGVGTIRYDTIDEINVDS